jgi:hypothetical protein
LLSWRLKTTTFGVKLTSHSPPPTPLLPALTLSAGEHKVSGGESKVSRRVGLPRSARAPRSRPKWPPSIFGGLLETPVLCRRGAKRQTHHLLPSETITTTSVSRRVSRATLASDCGRLGRQAAGHPWSALRVAKSCRKDCPTAKVLPKPKQQLCIQTVPELTI